MRAHFLDDNSPISPMLLEEHGVVYQHLDLEDRRYQRALQELCTVRGYVTQDEVKLSPETPNLPTVLAKFAPEHLHDDDEVRFVLAGEGIFDVRSNDERWMHIVVEPGDLIVVPKGKNHRFFLTDKQHIHCVRLFKDAAGWVPVYRAA